MKKTFRSPGKHSIKINHIPRTVTQEKLQRTFLKYGQGSVILYQGPQENYAYVNYYCAAAAQDAVREMNLMSLDSGGSVITVRVQGERRHSGSANTVKVTNLSKTVTKEMIEAYFSFRDSVEIESVKIVDVTGGLSNYAYVNYTSYEDGKRAEKEMNGVQIDGCKIAVRMHGTSTLTSPITSPLSSSPQQSGENLASPNPPFQLSKSSTVKVTFSGKLSVDDLEKFFSKYGALKDKPIIRGERLKYAYINFEEQSSALKARSLQGYKIEHCKVTVRLADTKFQSSKPPSKPLESCKPLPCNSLIIRLLLTSERYSEELDDVTSAHQITIKEMKKGNGANVWGTEENIDLALPLIETLLRTIRSDLQEQSFTFPCLYIPLFQVPEIVSMVSQIEKKHSVEVLVMDTAGLAQDVGAFSQVVTSEFASQEDTPPQVGCLMKYLKTSPDQDRPRPPQEYQWLWEDDKGGYTPYSPKLCSEINKEFAVSPKGMLQSRTSTIKGEKRYTIDFAAMTQTNMETKYVRRIKFQSKSAPTQQSNGIPFKNYQMTLQFRGPLENLKTAKRALKDELKQSIVSKQHPLPATSDDGFCSSLLEMTSQYFVFAKLVGRSSIELQGIQGHIEPVMLRVKEEMLSHEKLVLSRRAIASARYQVPSNWEHQTEKIVLKRLKQATPEWNRVCAHAMRTLTSVHIISVERIQNKWLWEKYCFSKQRMSDKNKGAVNEKELFHGTRSTPPEKVYKSEQGFDFRFSYNGMWGTGTYFAVNASYSNSYAFQSGQSKQMILAKVLTGETMRCPPDNSLKKPPIKKQSALGPIAKLLSSGSEFEDELYDSVSGHTNGSDIFVIYDHEKAYPAYLIEYK